MWAKLIAGLIALGNKIATFINNLQMMDAGAAKQEVKNREEADKLTADIKRDQSDDGLLAEKRKKYTRTDV